MKTIPHPGPTPAGMPLNSTRRAILLEMPRAPATEIKPIAEQTQGWSTNRQPDKEPLKSLYLTYLANVSQNAQSLASIVRRLLHIGATCKELELWAVESGHRDSYVRQVLSQILCEAGIRRRKPGAGRETPQEALTLLAYARQQFQNGATKFLLAAYRAAKSQEKLETVSLKETSGRVLGTA